MANLDVMPSDQEPRRSSPHNVVAAVLAIAIVGAAATLFMLNRGKLHKPTTGELLRVALEENLPGTKPSVSFNEDTIVIAIQVSFDPTVDAESALNMFQRVRTIAREQAIERKTGLEIELVGMNPEGRKTSTTQTFDYGVGEDG